MEQRRNGQKTQEGRQVTHKCFGFDLLTHIELYVRVETRLWVFRMPDHRYAPETKDACEVKICA